MSSPLSDAEIGYASAQTLRSLYASGEVAPSEAVAAVLRRIEALEPGLNAFSATMADEDTVTFEMVEREVESKDDDAASATVGEGGDDNGDDAPSSDS